MRCKFLSITFLLVFFCSFLVKAQSSDDDYVYKDSTVNIENIVEKKSNDSSKIDKRNITDTSLQVNQYSLINDSAEALKNTPDFAYAKNLDSILKLLQKEELSEGKPVRKKSSWLELFFFSPITKIFFWLIGCLFIGFILYRLFFTEGFFKKRTLQTNVTILKEEEEHLSATTDYSKLILQAIAGKHYRLAIRYHYLQTLQKLSAKEIILFSVDKTNHQYVSELSDKPYKNEFVRLTIAYEYAWYGGFVTDEAMFNSIQTNFKNFNDLI